MDKTITITAEASAAITTILNKFKEGNIPDEDMLICWNLELELAKTMGFPDYYNYSYALVNKLSVGWKHHTGNAPYPVPNSLYKEGYPPWEGEELKLRLDLIDYLLPQIKEGTTYTSKHFGDEEEEDG